MGRDILDTNKLIRQWGRRWRQPTAAWTPTDAEAWADELIRLYETNWILTPIYLEFIGGTRESRELTLARAFLGCFAIDDGGRILPLDWEKAWKIAERVPLDGKKRGAVDCLIRALCTRLRFELITSDLGMPRH